MTSITFSGLSGVIVLTLALFGALAAAGAVLILIMGRVVTPREYEPTRAPNGGWYPTRRRESCIRDAFHGEPIAASASASESTPEAKS